MYSIFDALVWRRLLRWVVNQFNGGSALDYTFVKDYCELTVCTIVVALPYSKFTASRYSEG